MNKIYRFIADLVYPNICPICGTFIEWNRYVCCSCLQELKPSDGEELEALTYKDCGFSGVIAPFLYSGTARAGILSLKNGQKSFGCFLGEILGNAVMNDKMICQADLIVPVPMSAEKRRERGYNQAQVIAKEISSVTGIRTNNKILYKNKSAQQHILSREQRKVNVSSFGINNCTLDGMKIILCDDVITTGSTADKCTELLKAKGAAEVYVAAGTTTKLEKGMN